MGRLVPRGPVLVIKTLLSLSSVCIFAIEKYSHLQAGHKGALPITFSCIHICAQRAEGGRCPSIG